MNGSGQPTDPNGAYSRQPQRRWVGDGDVFCGDGQFYAHQSCVRAPGRSGLPGPDHPRVLEVLDEHNQAHGLAFDDPDIHLVCPGHGFEYTIKPAATATAPNNGQGTQS